MENQGHFFTRIFSYFYVEAMLQTSRLQAAQSCTSYIPPFSSHPFSCPPGFGLLIIVFPAHPCSSLFYPHILLRFSMRIHTTLTPVPALFYISPIFIVPAVLYFCNNKHQAVVPKRLGAVAQRLERATDDCVVAGSNPTEAAWKLFCQFPLPDFPSVFRRDTKTRGSLLSGVYPRGSKISHTGGKCVTCHIVPGPKCRHDADQK